MTNAFHLFYVHSHITYLIVKAIIRDKSIDPSNCLFWVHDEYRLPDNPFQIEVVPHNRDLAQYSKFYGHNASSVRKFIEDFDADISRMTKGRWFVFYPTFTTAPVFRIVITHKKCISFCAIEEGFNPVMADKSHVLPKFKKSLMEKCNDGRLLQFNGLPIDITHPKYDGMFVVFKENYPCVEDRKVVLPNVFEITDCQILEGADALLIMDCGVNAMRLSAKPYFKSLKWLIDGFFLPRGYKRVCVRYRYRFNYDMPKREKEFLKQYADIEFVEIEDNIVTENLLYSCNIPVFFDGSSLGMYAACFGKEVYSYIKVHAAFDASFRYKSIQYREMDRFMIPFGVNMLNPIDKRGKPLSFAKEPIIAYLKRKTFDLARRFLPYSVLGCSQKLEEMYRQWRGKKS